MANTHNLFLEFNKNLRIPQLKKYAIIKSKNALRARIKNHFRAHYPLYRPFFYIQGSYKMNTAIRNYDDTCDLDDGVYFLRLPNVTGTTLQKWICEAVAGQTSYRPERRERCVRVHYQAGYHIDLPVYYIEESDKHPYIAVKNSDWQESDPKEFIKYFKNISLGQFQISRLIKYLKAWCDFQNHKMPNGLCMTVLCLQNYNIKYLSRDDLAFVELLLNIRRSLSSNWECLMPTTPYDNLFDRYSDTVQRNFFDSINSIIRDGKSAIKFSTGEYDASLLWQEHVGSRFPTGDD
jgi:hypothetical protein